MCKRYYCYRSSSVHNNSTTPETQYQDSMSACISMETHGHRIGNLSYDHSCSNSGHPSKADFYFFAFRMQALHKPLYVAANKAEPKLLCTRATMKRSWTVKAMKRSWTVVGHTL